MDDQFKVCGNCGNCTMIDGEFVCIDPAKPAQVAVRMGEREACFVVAPITPAQTVAAALAPVVSATIQ